MNNISSPMESPDLGPAAEEPEFELSQFLGRAHPGEIWLARGPAGVRRLVRVFYREAAGSDVEFEVCWMRLHAWASLTRGLPRHLQVLHVGRRSRPDCIYCVLEAPDPIPGPSDYAPTQIASILRRHGPLLPDESRELGLGLAEALEQLHRAGFVHGAVSAQNVFIVEGKPRLGPPDLRLGTPGTYLEARLQPESDVQAALELVEEAGRDVARPRLALRDALLHRVVNLILPSRHPAPERHASAANLRAVWRETGIRRAIGSAPSVGRPRRRCVTVALAFAFILLGVGLERFRGTTTRIGEGVEIRRTIEKWAQTAWASVQSGSRRSPRVP